MSNVHKDIGVSVADRETATAIVRCPTCGTRWQLGGTPGESARCRCSKCSTVFAAATVARGYRLRAVSDPEAPSPEPSLIAARVREPESGLDLRIGMDDPTLADKVAESALNRRGAGSRPAWTWAVVNEDPASAGRAVESPAAEDPIADDRAPADRPDRDASDAPVSVGPASLRESPLPVADAAPPPAAVPLRTEPAGPAASTDEPVRPAAPDPSHDGETGPDDAAEPPRGSNVVGLLVAVGLAAAGAAGGWYGARWLRDAAERILEWAPPTWSVGPVPVDPAFWAGPGAAFGLLLAWGWVRWTGRER